MVFDKPYGGRRRGTVTEAHGPTGIFSLKYSYTVRDDSGRIWTGTERLMTLLGGVIHVGTEVEFLGIERKMKIVSMERIFK